MKGNYDQHHRELEFVESDWVWMRLHHRLAATLTNKARGKLAPKFYVSFQVLACISPIAYRLALPPKCRIHDVFHVLFLKKFTGTPPAVVPRLPPIKHGRMLPQPEKVLRTRLNRGVWEILVQWMGQTTADATWEKVPEFKDAYPSFQLKDELFSIWGGGVLWMLSLGENISDGPSQERPSRPNQRCPQPRRRSPHPCRA
jgi:hypothetical protein